MASQIILSSEQSIATCSSLLSFIEKYIKKVLVEVDFFISKLHRINGKVCMQQFARKEITPGRVIRFMKSELADQLSEGELRNLFQWSVLKFKDGRLLIIEQYVSKVVERVNTKIEKTPKFLNTAI